MRIPRARLLGRVQDLIGAAKSNYENDRDPNRWDHVVPLLVEAFDIVVILRGKDSPTRKSMSLDEFLERGGRP